MRGSLPSEGICILKGEGGLPSVGSASDGVCIRGGSAFGRGCSSASRHQGREPGNTFNARAVLILLEWILVSIDEHSG